MTERKNKTLVLFLSALENNGIDLDIFHEEGRVELITSHREPYEAGLVRGRDMRGRGYVLQDDIFILNGYNYYGVNLETAMSLDKRIFEQFKKGFYEGLSTESFLEAYARKINEE